MGIADNMVACILSMLELYISRCFYCNLYEAVTRTMCRFVDYISKQMFLNVSGLEFVPIHKLK